MFVKELCAWRRVSNLSLMTEEPVWALGPPRRERPKELLGAACSPGTACPAPPGLPETSQLPSYHALGCYQEPLSRGSETQDPREGFFQAPQYAWAKGSCSSAGEGVFARMEAGLGHQVSPSGVHLLPLPQHCVESWTPGLLSLWFCAASWGGQWVKADTASVPRCPLSGREEKDLSSHGEVWWILQTGFHLCFLFTVAVFGYTACFVGS